MSLDLDRIQALLFDVDGTLSDTDDHLVHRLARLLTPFRMFFPGRDVLHAARRFVMWSEAPGNFLIGLPDRFGLDDELYALIDRFSRAGGGKRIKSFWIIPGVKELLQRLHTRYPMAVVSAREGSSTRKFLEQYDLLPYFDPIVTALSAEHTKPFPDPILFAAKAMGVEPHNCLMVGDTTVDILSARAAGAQSVGVLCGFGEEKELRQKGADLILPTTADLAQVLLGVDPAA